MQGIELAQKFAAQAGQTTQPDASDPAALHSAALNVDIRKRGLGRLPEAVAATDHAVVTGPLIVQLGEVSDVSKPAKVPGSSAQPLFACQVSDGRLQALAIALAGKLLGFDANTPPGTKMRLRGATIRHGLLLLDSACAEVRTVTLLPDSAGQECSAAKGLGEVRLAVVCA